MLARATGPFVASCLQWMLRVTLTLFPSLLYISYIRTCDNYLHCSASSCMHARHYSTTNSMSGKKERFLKRHCLAIIQHHTEHSILHKATIEQQMVHRNAQASPDNPSMSGAELQTKRSTEICAASTVQKTYFRMLIEVQNLGFAHQRCFMV